MFLQRNLKLMLSMSTSDNDNRFQLIKKEVIDMIKIQTPSMELKVCLGHFFVVVVMFTL